MEPRRSELSDRRTMSCLTRFGVLWWMIRALRSRYLAEVFFQVKLRATSRRLVSG